MSEIGESPAGITQGLSLRPQKVEKVEVPLGPGKKSEGGKDSRSIVMGESRPAAEEKTRTYDDPNRDPVVKAVLVGILRRTNTDPILTSESQLYRGEDYSERWNRAYARESRAGWNDFLDQYSEKAAAYRDELKPVREAFEGRERLRRYQQEWGRREATRPKTIDGDLRFRAFMDHPQTGLNVQVWAGVSPAESLTTAQYDKKARAIKARMEGEFAVAHPDIWEKYQAEGEQRSFGETIAVSRPTQEVAGAIETSKEPAVVSTDEVLQKIQGQVAEKESLSIQELDTRRVALGERPMLQGRDLLEVIEGAQYETSFSWIPTNKVAGAWLFDEGWRYELDAQKEKLLELAETIQGAQGDPKAARGIFAPEQSRQRIIVTKIDGPQGSVYLLDEGTRRTTAALMLELTEIPADVRALRYPAHQVSRDKGQAGDWERLIQLGLVKGRVNQDVGDDGKPEYTLTVSREVIPWLRESSFSKIRRISGVYEYYYPGSLDNLAIPKEALFDPIAYNFYMAGRWDEWLQRQQG